MTITDGQVQLLETLWRKGRTLKQAAHGAAVSTCTAWRYFVRFEADGIPRGAHLQASARVMLAGPTPPPIYTGPSWIGKRCGPVPIPKHDGRWVF